ncbi:tetratricopeptide repeat protein [Pseudohalocynthiibacter sp. F2068]|jgi:tetratricopeptide (TPR) repeat protein|uniref:tetratricopeptide repeat protein n=1 Tax=Pseudohalocynthiibacter sp. F2068 TaxID=2926418 RepID=UPI001FF11758|nr:tetratricopeptide repeat protein [Pseudohalocynthiibacter sp. F2068]MCK0104314.1 tetratricopeptide repeat protein [Pseudohalocynthiibacter sp. F2068]
MIRRLLLGVLLAGSLSFLVACDTAEERAEKHFQTALEHLENGDEIRAIVEFRNVFKLNGRHQEARLTFARLKRSRGELVEAYGQYLRLVEQYPENLEGRRALSQMAVDAEDWEEAARHGAVATEMAPDDPVVRAVNINLDYHSAIQNRNLAAQTAAREKAQALVVDFPDLMTAHRVIIRDLLRRRDWPAVLAAIDAAPEAPEIFPLRLGVLNELGDTEAFEAHLKELIDRFPDEAALPEALVHWYMSRGNADAAEAFLRSRLDPAAASPKAEVTLIRFLSNVRGPDVAAAELDRIIAENVSNKTLYRTLRAALLFETGERDQAISELEALLAELGPSDATNSIKVTLAQMLINAENPVGARNLVEEVLASDPRQVEATKLKAAWLIDDDKTGEAIASLREALSQSPRDPAIMTLLARAHERDGNRDLVAEMLSLAVEASRSAPDTSLRYATFLLMEGKEISAEGILQNALRLQPGNPQILRALGQTYVRLKDWGRVEGVIQALRKIDPTGSQDVINELTARKLSGQELEDDLQSFLKGLTTEGQGNVGVDVAIVQAHINRGNLPAARAYLNSALAQRPDSNVLYFVLGSVQAMDDQIDEAETTFRSILEKTPEAERVWVALYRLHLSQKDEAKAGAVLEQAQEALPDNVDLKLIHAGALERKDDLDGAILVYEALYALDSSNLVVANNLASLLTTHRDDAESLERAYIIGRRLRSRDFAPFQDTYGWIAYLRGNYEDALIHLRPASAGLPGDPEVQYHLAMTYVALERYGEALAQFEKTAELVGPVQKPHFMDTVTAEIARLSSVRDAVEGVPENGTTEGEGN